MKHSFVPATLLFVMPRGALAFIAGGAWRALSGRVLFLVKIATQLLGEEVT